MRNDGQWYRNIIKKKENTCLEQSKNVIFSKKVLRVFCYQFCFKNINNSEKISLKHNMTPLHISHIQNARVMKYKTKYLEVQKISNKKRYM